MNRGERITIERAANGFIVRATDIDRGVLVSPESMMVFNDMGTAVALSEGQPAEKTLLGFIQRHFSDQPT